MENERRVSVRILNLMGGGGCESCGSPGVAPEYVKMLRQKVEELQAELDATYPGKTELEYVDLDQAPIEKASEAGKLLVTGIYPPPLVLIDGLPMFAGYISINKILEEVGKVLS